MKLVPVVAALVLAGCSRPSHTIQAQVAEGTPTSASVEVCGKVTPLPADGPGRFSGSREISCKSRGLLRVAFADGGEVTCPIGAAAKQGQDWSFIATRRGCRAFADPRAMTLRVTQTPAPAPKHAAP